MPTKPTSTLRWADSGGAIVVPPDGKKDVGYVKGEPPPAEFENWFKNLAGQWAQFIHDRSSLVANATPLAIYRDWLNHIRHVVDRNGYPMGHFATFEDHALFDWAETGTGTFAASQDPSAAMPCRNAFFACGSGEDIEVNYAAGTGIAYFTQDMVYVQEWDLLTGSELDVAGANDAEFHAGVETGGALWAYFDGDTDNGANFICRRGITTGDSGVAVVADTRYRMKVEIVGDNNHAGSNELARFYINGALVQELAGTLADGTIGPQFKLRNPGAATSYDMTIGRVRACWNMSLDPQEDET